MSQETRLQTAAGVLVTLWEVGEESFPGADYRAMLQELMDDLADAQTAEITRGVVGLAESEQKLRVAASMARDYLLSPELAVGQVIDELEAALRASDTMQHPTFDERVRMIRFAVEDLEGALDRDGVDTLVAQDKDEARYGAYQPREGSTQG